MVFVKKDTEFGGRNFKKYALPVYVVISAILLVLVAVVFVKNSIYSVGMQKGYQIAVEQVMMNAAQKCEPLSLTANGQQLDIIAVQCLQQSDTTSGENINNNQVQTNTVSE